MIFDDFGSAVGGAMIGVVLPYIVAGIVIGVRTKDWNEALVRVGGMLKATVGVLRTGIDD